MKEYNKFLAGKISVEGVDINYLTIPTGEPNRRMGTKYAFFDSNGDKIPELHVNSGRYYYIFSYINNKLVVFKELSPYPQYYALKNGAFICWWPGAGPMSDAYNYIIYDYMGKEVWNVTFSKFDKNENNVYDENDEYKFDDVAVSKKTWDKLTKRYLYTDKNGIEQIRNEIKWTTLYDENGKYVKKKRNN
jgi:hypothetical protein